MSKARFIWVHGNAGVGKSVAVSRLWSELWLEQRLLAAVYFNHTPIVYNNDTNSNNYNNSNSNRDILYYILSIALQMQSFFKSYTDINTTLINNNIVTKYNECITQSISNIYALEQGHEVCYVLCILLLCVLCIF